MQDKRNYVDRDHVDDGKNDIEVSLPDFVKGVKAPKQKMHRGVALGFSTNLDFQLGKTMNITAGQVIYITDRPDKGKWVVLGEAGFGYRAPGGSGTGSLEVYDYYGHIRNFSMKFFWGDSKSTSIMTGN